MALTKAERGARENARRRGEYVERLPGGVPKGYKQSPEHLANRAKSWHYGASHHRWAGDGPDVPINIGRKRARRIFTNIGPCSLCGSARSERHHKDGNPLNNAPANIQSVCHACHLLLHSADNSIRNSGERNSHAKLTAVDVRAIRSLIAAGSTRVSIALKFGVSPANISMIATNRTWLSVK